MTRLRLATVNVNGIRAAFRKGMGDWLQGRDVDVLALQEVRASTDDLQELLGEDWNVVHDPATAKGRAGVAIASRDRARIHRVELGPDDFDSAGRWLEADYEVGDAVVTVVSTYVHSGEADTPKQDEKWRFLDAMEQRLPALQRHNELAVVVGDLNVGHDERDIKNWKGNVKRAGFLPRERAYFDRFLGAAGEQVDCVDGTTGTGLGWVDVGREQAGDVPGPYTWWSWRGQAFDNDSGWRIDYQMATPALAAKVTAYAVDRAAAYDQRWSDHTPVVVDYEV
ncbi:MULTISPECIES: exodeoxyribonuclease III [unclassified Curtobacterium]|uniref:exodeoxyribonuclease III n=1 Tax=unclassified Curtobacterium TaxID=257496 RepID=UPI000DA9DFB8|nr:MULTISPECIES: exodeoxyribonuclease III [unclassified Curtobacterium]PZE26462.1 exodeoxyribonuclease III [Curtobacterium sp. MCBD17_028]PZE75120.1 exodeoxyribonuclease III [Curtobacterium sp. MCBD17_019]PZF58553.1 exodeoxyribonuclease III [Curtobacterium sp. MCBD17_034]PZF64397.1 exodeoxyribonuclease III [Curtobacterium sp. MCBD17_013]PZM34542.1 exodeoxyribonuclease III [Curtobacterium sp. MCBD17_031]